MALNDSRFSRAILLLISVWILCGTLPTCTQAEIVYEVIDLGALGGDESSANSINDAGQIVGESYNSEGYRHATLFDPTGADNNVDLGTLGGDSSVANSINNAGQIVGGADHLESWHSATLFDPTGERNNIDLGIGQVLVSSSATSINDAGQIVGYSIRRGLGGSIREFYATLFDPNRAGKNINLGTLESYFSEARSINNLGKIVGLAGGRAVLFDPTGAGNNVNLGTLGGWNSEATSINEAGQIVGGAKNDQGDYHAALFDPNGAGNNVDLGALGDSCPHSIAYSINNLGQIVGRSYIPNLIGACATLFDPTGAGNNIDLNVLIDPNSGWTLERANDINNSGRIVGQGINPQGKTHAFLLVPISTKYSGGTGEPNDPYQIATSKDLMLLGETPEDYDKHFILTSDIDLDPNLPSRKIFDRAVIGPDMNDVDEGFQGVPFTGVFDGNGHKISHLTVKSIGYLGLFGNLSSGAKIIDLGLEAVDVNGIGDYVGGLVGSNEGSIITNYSTGTVKGNSCVGGLVGENGGIISMSYGTGIVSGNGFVGGLVGDNEWEGNITMSYSTGTVSGDWCVGGLAGFNDETVTQCWSSAMVKGGEDASGGLIGTNQGYVSNCYSTGDVSGINMVGGLTGRHQVYAGMGPARKGIITACYSAGAVKGDQTVGGLAGGARGQLGLPFIGPGSFVMPMSFWDIETSGQLSSLGGTGKTTIEMQTARTFLEAGWDFIDETENGTEDIWWILEGQDYPRLWWEAEEE